MKSSKMRGRQATCSSAAPRWMLMIAFGLVALLALALVYQFLLRPAMAKYERYEDVQKGTLVLAHMEGCGWCKRMMPEWNRLKAEHGAELSKAGISLKEVEASESDKIRPYKAHVQGYPTILWVPADGQAVVKYNGERTAEALLQFAKSGGKELFEEEEPQKGSSSSKVWSGLAASVERSRQSALSFSAR